MNRKPAWFKGVVVGGLAGQPRYRALSSPFDFEYHDSLEWHFESDGTGVEKIPAEIVKKGHEPLISVTVRPGFDIDDVVMALTQVIYDLNEYHL
jgi:hypothetical protein